MIETLDLAGYEVLSLILFKESLLTRDIPVYGEPGASCALLTIKKVGGEEKEVVYLYSSEKTPLAMKREKVSSLT